MGTKENPGQYDCYAAAEPHEPIFTLLARDPLAPGLVDEWAAARELLEKQGFKKPSNKADEARECAKSMREYQHRYATAAEAVGRKYERPTLRPIKPQWGPPVNPWSPDYLAGLRRGIAWGFLFGFHAVVAVWIIYLSIKSLTEGQPL